VLRARQHVQPAVGVERGGVATQAVSSSGSSRAVAAKARPGVARIAATPGAGLEIEWSMCDGAADQDRQ
jgi:hypothetical protein